MIQLGGALLITIVSSCLLNVGYLIEHRVASRLPPLSIRRPIHSLRLLAGNRTWLLGFGSEAAGWGLFVVAVALAPLSLVQAAAAGGIGILAILVSTVGHVPLLRREKVGVVISMTGLVLLGLSIRPAQEGGTESAYLPLGIWLGASFAAALLAILIGRTAGAGGAGQGIATGILFAAGDVSVKAALEGGGKLVFAVGIVACYGLGTAVLQSGFQRGGALTTAGLATLFTNAVPIVAGMTIFGESLPEGAPGVLRVISFVLVVGGAVALARTDEAQREQATSVDPAVPAAG